MLPIALMWLALAAGPLDQLHPEWVIDCRYKIGETTSPVAGDPQHPRDYLLAEGICHRREGGEWEMTIGEFPLTERGRHQAEKASSHWLDRVMRLVRAAQH